MAREVHPFEAWSGEQFFAAEDRAADYPAILYFERKAPAAVTESGLYVGYRDFSDVCRRDRLYRPPEPYVRLFHTLVLHFTEQVVPEFTSKAYGDLRYRPDNHSHWNNYAPTWKYWLLGSMLLPYSEVSIDYEWKIKGVGPKGRETLRAVLYDEIELDTSGTELSRRSRFEEPDAEPDDAAVFGYSLQEFRLMGQ